LNNKFYSVIIPFHGDIMLLSKTLQSLEETQYLEKEIIVVNDGTTCNFNSIIERHKCKLINFDRNRGPSFARNAAAKEAKFGYLVFLDSDIIVPRNCFIEMNKFFDNNPSVVALNSLMSKQSPYKNFLSEYINMIYRYGLLKEGKEKVFTFFCAIEAKAFWEIGGFDETVSGPYADDVILGWKLKNRGYKFNLAERIEVQHYKKMTLLSFIMYYFRHSYFFAKYFAIYRNSLKISKLFYKREGFFSIVTILTFFAAIYLKILDFLPAFYVFLGIFISLNINLLKFLLRGKNFFFAFKAVWAAIIHYSVYSFGSVLGLLNGFLKKNKKVKV